MAGLFDDIPTAGTPESSGTLFDDIPVAKATPGYAEDIGKGVVGGATRGALGVVGGVRDANDAAGYGTSWLIAKLAEKLGLLPEGKTADQLIAATKKLDIPEDPFSMPSSHQLTKAVEDQTGPLYKAKTVPGQYAETLAEFAPSAIMGSGSAAQRLAQVAIPALTSETAGQVTKGTAAEPYARFGGAMVGGIGTALAQRPAASERILTRSMEGIAPAQIKQAETLMDDAARFGVPITWDEAIGHVTNGASKQLTNVRRVVQNSPDGAGVFNPMMAERPGQVAAAADTNLGSLVPGAPLDSASTGQRVMKAADSSLADTQTAINAVTRPDYVAAGRQSITPQVARALQGDPLYAQAMKEVRGDPALNRGIAHLPDDSVAVVDLVQRRLRETAENARMPGQANTSNLRAANFEDARTAPLTAAEQATGGPMGDYARARQTQATLRQQMLEPLEAGPLGTMRGTADVNKQAGALLPNKPAYASEIPTAQAMGRLVSKDPEAAANLLHSHLRTAFDEATQNLQSGQNQFGGAKFAAIVRGNGQQAQNLKTAVEQLPNGADRWKGLNRFLDVLESTGQAPAQGSMTSFNTAIQKELGNGGLMQGGAEIAGTGGLAWVKKAGRLAEDWNAGRNSQQIARILTAPNSGRLLERLAELPPGSRQAQTLALRLAYMGRTALKKPSED
jgi:hypothetical protein